MLALLWPGRITGPFHGLPLDGLADAIVVGVAFPVLWCFHGAFLATRGARVLIATIIVWKAFSTAALVQDGWCVRVMPSRPYAMGAEGAPHSWDVRADWRSPEPACSAIMTRGFRDLHEFPVWFFNLPPPNESWPQPEDLPPAAHVSMSVQGFVYTPRPGLLHVDTTQDVTVGIHADGGHAVEAAYLGPGLHTIVIDTSMSGDRWRFVPTFDSMDLWAAATPTVRRPSHLDLIVRPWGA